MTEGPPNDVQSPGPPNGSSRMNWVKFFGFLFAPAILSPIFLSLRSDDLKLVGVVIALGGSVLVGVLCAGTLARHLSEPKSAWGSLALFLGCLLVPLSLGLCFLGCSALSFHK